jgi:hypothetical protein
LATDAVTIDEISQDAVDTDNIVDAAVIEQKLSNLSVSETKIQDSSISTPKLQATSITSGKIVAGAVDTLQLAAEAVFADKIASDTITANEIDVLDLNTGELTVSDASVDGEISFANENINGVDTVEILQSDSLGNGAIGTFGTPWDFGFFVRVRPDNDDTGFVGESAAAYSEMWAYDYFDAATDTAINDGGDPLAGLADGHGPPDHAAVHDDETGEVKGHSLNEMARSVWDVVRAQQRRIDDLESRLAALEGDNA